MIRSLNRFVMIFLSATLAALLALGGAWSAATPADKPMAVVSTQAEKLFPDAPDGVDPIVTGPVSAAFKQRQADAGCDKAAWPNVPAACFEH
ncbi:hypothetical protein [Mesorhizobium sp. 1M-11]|uniref:hypothetical protein n=1 Tax=Mesorhizobium sp. 1M-11 TaxID=1529006 RepID=UPI0006C73F5A|nr:hypothetical protein [Mesorhizobium sp. 1M-11]